MRLRSNDLCLARIPPPPIPGTDTIIPLTTLKELKQEGVEQQNCVGIYGPRMARGDTYVYKVLSPERATLSIIRDPGGTWHRRQIRIARNREPTPFTVRAVDEWLASHAASI